VFCQVSIPCCDRSEKDHPAVCVDNVDFCEKLFKKSFEGKYAGTAHYKHHVKAMKFPCASRIIPRRALVTDLCSPNDVMQLKTRTFGDNQKWNSLFTVQNFWPNYFWKDGNPPACKSLRSIINLKFIYFMNGSSTRDPQYVSPHADLIISVLEERIFRAVPRTGGLVLSTEGTKMSSKNVYAAMFNGGDDDDDDGDANGDGENDDVVVVQQRSAADDKGTFKDKRRKRAEPAATAAAAATASRPITEDIESDTPSEDYNFS